MKRSVLALAAVGVFAVLTSLAAGSTSRRPGALDPTFGRAGIVRTHFPVFAGDGCCADTLALQRNGKIVLAGWKRLPGKRTAFALTRYQRDGALDRNFGRHGVASAVPARVSAAAAVGLEPDGKLVATGSHWSGPNKPRPLTLVRFDQRGRLDPTFGSGGVVSTDPKALLGLAYFGPPTSMAIQPDGKILVTFYAEKYDAQKGVSYDALAVARYNLDGSLDPTFGSGGFAMTFFTDDCCLILEDRDVAVEPDGKILVAGWIGNDLLPGGYDSLELLRYNADGSTDQSFGKNGIVTGPLAPNENPGPISLAFQSDGKIVVGGENEGGLALTRLQEGGSMDKGFGQHGIVTALFGGQSADVGAVTLQPGGRILVAGTAEGGTNRKARNWGVLARYLADGRLDRRFGQGGKTFIRLGKLSSASSLALQRTKVIVSGSVSSVSHGVTNSRFILARYRGRR